MVLRLAGERLKQEKGDEARMGEEGVEGWGLLRQTAF